MNIKTSVINFVNHIKVLLEPKLHQKKRPIYSFFTVFGALAPHG